MSKNRKTLMLHPPLIQTKLAISQPGDKYEQEADRIAEAVVSSDHKANGKPISFATLPLIQRQGQPDAEQSNDKKLKKSAEKIGEALLKTSLVQEMKEKALKLGTKFINTLPGKVITGAAAVSTVSYLAATNSQLPMQLPEIPLDVVTPGLKVKLTYEGPVRNPTAASITFIFEEKAKSEEKKGMTEAEKYRAETARIAADQERFREGLKSPEQRAKEKAQFERALWEGRDPLGLRPLNIPGIKREDELLQRKVADNSAIDSFVPPIVHEVLNSPGQPLDPATREYMEPRFGHDFSRVRIHIDDKAVESASAVNARAFTVGKDIVFGSGQHAPESIEGRRLLAHELTHVMQQVQPAVSSDLRLNNTAVMQTEKKARNTEKTADERHASISPTQRSATLLLQRNGSSTSKLEKHDSVQNIKIRAILEQNEFENRVLAIAEGWQIAARDIGSAYAIASKRHTDAIINDAARAALETQIMLSILTSFVAGGFSWVVGAASVSQMTPEKLLGPQLQTAAHSGVERLIITPSHRLVDPRGRPIGTSATTTPSTPSSASPTPYMPSIGTFGWEEAGSEAAQQAVGLAAQAAGSGPVPVSGDPLVFQNERANMVSNAKRQAYLFFAELSRQLHDLPTEKWASFDEQAQVAAHQKWLQSAQLLGSTDNLPNIDTMANEIERGFWAEWAKRVRPSVSYAIHPMVDYPPIRNNVAERLRSLQIASQAGLDLGGFRFFSKGYLFYESTFDDWKKLKRWSNNYIPRPFFPVTR